MRDLWVRVGIDVAQAEKLWEAMVTTQVAHGKAEAEAMTTASMEIVAGAFPMAMLPTATPASFPPPPPIRQSAGGGQGPLTTLV